MSLHHTRSLAEKVAKWVCSGAPTCLHCEATKALQEVEAVERLAVGWELWGRATLDGAATLQRIAEETRTRS